MLPARRPSFLCFAKRSSIRRVSFLHARYKLSTRTRLTGGRLKRRTAECKAPRARAARVRSPPLTGRRRAAAQGRTLQAAAQRPGRGAHADRGGGGALRGAGRRQAAAGPAGGRAARQVWGGLFCFSGVGVWQRPCGAHPLRAAHVSPLLVCLGAKKEQRRSHPTCHLTGLRTTPGAPPRRQGSRRQRKAQTRRSAGEAAER
jgi:hypothetical protein